MKSNHWLSDARKNSLEDAIDKIKIFLLVIGLIFIGIIPILVGYGIWSLITPDSDLVMVLTIGLIFFICAPIAIFLWMIIILIIDEVIF